MSEDILSKKVTIRLSPTQFHELEQMPGTRMGKKARYFYLKGLKADQLNQQLEGVNLMLEIANARVEELNGALTDFFNLFHDLVNRKAIELNEADIKRLKIIQGVLKHE